MRIGMMTDLYKPNISGVTNYIALNKRVLENRGHKVFVFTFGDLEYEDDELHVIRSPGVPLTVNDRGFQVSFRYSRVAQHKVKSMDLVHVHDLVLSAPLALRYCRPNDIPIVFTNHTRYDLYAQHYLPNYVPDTLSHGLLRVFLPSFCQRCDLVIAPSPGIRGVMQQLGVTAPIHVIPNGIDLTPFQNPNRRLTRSEVGLSDSQVVFIYVGRLSPEKNLAFLLRAFAGVAAAQPGVTLAVVGSGPELDNLVDQAARSGLAERVRFFGPVEYADVPAYLALADVFVTPSQTEVHPLSVLEAMAAGLPALGIDSPGVGDIIVDGENGYLCPPDLAMFTARLMQLSLEPLTRRRFAEEARVTAQAYDINRTAASICDEYERLAAQRARRPAVH